MLFLIRVDKNYLLKKTGLKDLYSCKNLISKEKNSNY